jgi:DNA polymerase-3 subunit epsilon
MAGGIAVVDVETTGLYPSDRVVEIGVVLLDSFGQFEGSFTTVVNPERDVGPTHIHGLTAADVVGAPTFRDVAPQLAEVLAGRLPVAHNASFDLTFLARECDQAGVDFPSVSPAVCTMRMSSQLLGSVRSLAGACSYLSINLDHHHAALADAMAAAQVFGRLVFEVGDPSNVAGAGVFQWDHNVGRLYTHQADLAALIGDAAHAWIRPSSSAPVQLCSRTQAAAHRAEEASRLARLLTQLPPGPAVTDDAADYLGLLDQVLLDRRVEADEVELIGLTAARLGLTRDAVVELHRRYVDQVATAVLLDDVVTAQEVADLELVCDLLGLPRSGVPEALNSARTTAQSQLDIGVNLRPDDRVAFTGEMSMPRSALTTLAQAAGLRVTGSVSKRTTLLVVADPTTLSAKAKAARTHGTVICSEQVFVYAAERLRRRGGATP